MPAYLEVPVFGSSSAATAVSAGASRIELNAQRSYPEGGLTPTVEDLSQLSALTVPVRLMIRPRGAPSSGSKDFIYSDDELDAMEQSIRAFKASGLMRAARGDGFVFGILKQPDGALAADEGVESGSGRVTLDVDRCRRFVEAARPFETVFHRAFDEIIGCDPGTSRQTPGWETTLQDLVSCGFDGVLTSGGPGNAINNILTLEQVIEMAGDSIEIIVGGGVRSTNVWELARRLKMGTQAEGSWVHSSCLTSKGTEDVDRKEVEDIMAHLE
ncbi:CutC family protein [Xylariales sp. AK1849]|nr:CutC family protein [Xylariales sp. AK1849]